MRNGIWVVGLALCGAGCIVEAPSGESARSPVAKAATVTQAPPLPVKVGANLQDTVELVGATLSPGRAAPGETVKVTAYYKVLQEMEVDYVIFVHADDADGRTDRINSDHRPVSGSYPTTKWKKGETVKDEFSLYVPPGIQARSLNLYMGFWDPKTDARLALKNTDQVRSDGNNRILVTQVPISK